MKRILCPLQIRCVFLRQSATDSKKYVKTLNHVPVLRKQVLSQLKVDDGHTFVDMTFGAGGHSTAILSGRKNVTLYAVDCDPLAIEFAKQLQSSQTLNKVIPICSRFSRIRDVLKLPNNSVDAMLIDCGTSSMQLDDPQRGFALSSNSFLDMRMHYSPHATPSPASVENVSEEQQIAREEKKSKRYTDISAYDVVNFLSVKSLREIFVKYGEERHAKRIAEAIVEARHELGAIRTTQELAEIVSLAVGSAAQQFDKVGRSQHVATRVFQALRIFVNDELNELANGLDAAHALLKPGGRCAVITFHSLEDRIVKRRFTNKLHEELLSGDRLKLDVQLDDDSLKRALTKKWQPLVDGVLEADEEEIRSNPRSRSAKLRIAVKNSHSNS